MRESVQKQSHPTRNDGRHNDRSVLDLLHRAIQQADLLFMQAMNGSGLTPRQLVVLKCVADNEDESQTHLVRKTGIDRSTLADVARRLVRQGLLKRRRTRQDARTYAVRLTEKGQDVLRRATPVAAHVDEQITSIVGAIELPPFVAALDAIGQSSSVVTSDS